MNKETREGSYACFSHDGFHDVLILANGPSAATVNLTDGRTVQGDIVKQDSKSLQISVDGVTMTYYADEIKDIDGKPLRPIRRSLQLLHPRKL